jgi:hypothetical protein
MIDENGSTSSKPQGQTVSPVRAKSSGGGQCRGHLLSVVAKAVRLAAKFKDVSPIGETIDQGGRQTGIPKDLRPVGKREVGRDQECHVVMQGGANLKQQLRPGR